MMQFKDIIKSKAPSYLTCVVDTEDDAGCPQLVFIAKNIDSWYSKNPLSDFYTKLNPVFKRYGYTLFDKDKDYNGQGYLAFSTDDSIPAVPNEIVISVGRCPFPDGDGTAFIVQVHLGYF